MVHRQGDSCTNADGLSRRPCGLDCAHYEHAKAKDTEAVREQTEGSMALRLDNTTDWAREQQGDPELNTVLGWLEVNQRPEWLQLALERPVVTVGGLGA